MSWAAAVVIIVAIWGLVSILRSGHSWARGSATDEEGNLIGNGPQCLQDIEVIADDFAFGGPGTCGKDGQGVPVGDGCPTLRVAQLTIGGTS